MVPCLARARRSTHACVVKMSASNPPKADLGLLEEDDEFEEFPVEGPEHADRSQSNICIPSLSFPDWTATEEDQGDVHVWEDNWDDDNVEDDFSKQLR